MDEKVEMCLGTYNNLMEDLYDYRADSEDLYELVNIILDMAELSYDEKSLSIQRTNCDEEMLISYLKVKYADRFEDKVRFLKKEKEEK